MRHRSFDTPPPDPPPRDPTLTHHDGCLRDYARYGFCDHTRLRPDVRSTAERRRRRTRNLLAWLSITLLIGTFVVLFTLIGWWAFAANVALGAGWLGIFLFGLPDALTADIRDTLPPDTKERLR